MCFFAPDEIQKCGIVCMSPSSEQSLSCSSNSLEVVEFVLILVVARHKNAMALRIVLTCHVQGMCERVWLVLGTGEEIKVSLIFCNGCCLYRWWLVDAQQSRSEWIGVGIENTR
jgi:hypothetical protein